MSDIHSFLLFYTNYIFRYADVFMLVGLVVNDYDVPCIQFFNFQLPRYMMLHDYNIMSLGCLFFYQSLVVLVVNDFHVPCIHFFFQPDFSFLVLSICFQDGQGN